MKKKTLIIFLMCLSFINPLIAYAEGQLNLNDLIDEAKKNNPDIKAALKRYESAKARIPQAKSLDDPVIGLKFEKAKGNPFNLSSTPAMDRMLSFSQMLPWFGKLSLKGKMALVESQMLAGEYKDKELEVINKVKNTYYELFMNYKEVELREGSLIFLRNIAVIAESRYMVGQIPQEDIFKLNLELSKLSTDIINLRQIKSAKETRLNSLLNREAEGTLGVPYLKKDFPPLNNDIDSLYKSTIENQPELLIFSYAIERNKYAKDLAKKSFFPDLMAGIVMRGLTTGTIGPWDLMMSFTVPLWFWTKQRYEIKEAVANLQEAQAAYSAMKNRAMSEVNDLVSKIKIAQNKINLYKSTQIPLIEGSIEVSRSAYLSEKGDIMMLLDSERMLIEARINYYSALVEYYMNFAELERTVGINLSQVK